MKMTEHSGNRYENKNNKEKIPYAYLFKSSPLNKSLMIFMVALALSALQEDCLIAQSIIPVNISFIPYPDFPEAHSTWGSIGYNPKFERIYIGVTNHFDKVGLYEYDPALTEMKLIGFINDLAYLRPFQWQGKIHSKFVFGPDGIVYFTTDGGESREEYLMDHPQGYSGGFFMKWNPDTRHMTNLGMAMPYESLKDLEIDPETDLLYAITYPQAHFIIYDPSKNEMQDLGRLASSHVPRVLFTDWWGNCYYTDWRQRLVKYEKDKKTLLFDRNSLPAFEDTPGSKIITGITAYAKDEKNKIIYLITYGAKILAFHPLEEGIGCVEDLGGVADTGDQPEWGPYVPNLNFGSNGNLYYFVGGHGNYIKEGIGLLMEFNPETHARTIIREFPSDELAEATGSDIKDKYGNMYFAGRSESKNSLRSRPFLIRFNPGKEVSK